MSYLPPPKHRGVSPVAARRTNAGSAWRRERRSVARPWQAPRISAERPPWRSRSGRGRCAWALAGWLPALLAAPAAPAQDQREPERAAPAGSRPGPPSDRAAYGRAALEMLGLLSIGTGQYWLSASANARDWDFPRWSERLDWHNVRFDNNTLVTNHVLHPLAGGGYYGFSRANGLSVGESVLYAQISSALWEWGLEWREKVSINDMIATTAAGTAVGEFWVQLAAYLNSAPDGGGWARELVASTLGFPVWMHDELDGRRPDPRPPKDSLGFSSAYRHRFTLDLQSAWLDDAADRRGAQRGVRLTAQLSSLPGFLEPESFRRWFAGGNFSEASLDLHFDGEGLATADVEFDAVLAGYYAQWAHAGVSGLLVGLGTGLEFVDRDTLDRGDQYGLAHFAGPSLAFFWSRESFDLTLATRLYGDLAAIRSLAWPSVRRADPDAGYKSTLERDYQYHLGFSSRSYAELRFHALLLSLEYTRGSYRSIEGLDRFQEQITRDLQGGETLDERRALLALEPPGTLIRAYAGVERSSHVSELGGLSAGRLERRFVTGLGLAF